MNIIGKNQGTWELKQAMPKFIVGVLIVPLSWFFVQFLLSVSAVLTIWVLTLPYDSFQDNELYSQALTDSEFADTPICREIIISLTGEFSDAGATPIAWGGEALSDNVKCREGATVTIEELFNPENESGLQNTMFGLMSMYTYGIIRVQDLDEITTTQVWSGIKSLANLVLKLLFDVLFIAVYCLLMVALFLALMVRGVRLWVYIMLSPAFGLLYFFWKASDGVGQDEKFSVKEFVNLAMVPVYVAAALSFGLTFILVASQGLQDSGVQTDETIEVGGFSLTIEGAHGSGKDAEGERSPIAKLIVELFGVAILWIAVMAALKSSSVTGAVVEPIAQFGKSVGQLAKAAPTYMPILPQSLGGSVAGLGQMGQTMQSNIESAMRSKGTEAAQKFWSEGMQQSMQLSNEAQNALSRLSRGNPQDKYSLEALKNAIQQGKDTNSIASNEKMVDLLNEYLKRTNNEDVTVVKWDASSVAKAIGTLDEYARRNGPNGFDLVGNGNQDNLTKTYSSTAAVDAAIAESSATINQGDTNVSIDVWGMTFSDAKDAGNKYAEMSSTYTSDTQVRENLLEQQKSDANITNQFIDDVVWAYQAAMNQKNQQTASSNSDSQTDNA